MTSPEVLVDPLLEALEGEIQGPAVVAIGGGHGLAQALKAVQLYAGEINAIVGVADDGGSSGRLAPALDIPPPGDMRRCLIALAPEPSTWRDLFSFRFEEGDVKGHSLGNLLLAALAELEGSFLEALRTAERHLGAVGSVIPAAPHPLQLEAVIDGAPVRGQLAIARARGTLTELRLEPQGITASPEALAAIFAADQIVVGPGSLFTSVIAALLVPGLAAAINDAEARLIYVCNLSTQDGETLGKDAADHVRALVDFTGLRSPDVVLANTADLVVSPPLTQVLVDEREFESLDTDLHLRDLAEPGADWPRHDPVRLAGGLAGLT